MTFPLSRSETPLLDQLKKLANLNDAAFYAPGHKKGQGISPLLANFLGSAVLRQIYPNYLNSITYLHLRE